MKLSITTVQAFVDKLAEELRERDIIIYRSTSSDRVSILDESELREVGKNRLQWKELEARSVTIYTDGMRVTLNNYSSSVSFIVNSLDFDEVYKQFKSAYEYLS
jgi:hypothetical protein